MSASTLKYYLLISLVVLQQATGITQSFTTKVYTTADGLSDNYIFCIYQDSYGYLWIGGPNGLNRFDGKRFANYSLKNGLPSLLVDKVYEDHHHRLWIGTRKGMAELKGDTFYTYPVNDKQDIYFVSGFIEPGNDRLWATTDKGIYELRNSAWEKISLFPGKDNSTVGRIVKTSQGLFINYDNNTLVHQNNDGHYKVILSVNTHLPYYNNLFEENDTIYISTYTGLQYWDGEKWVKKFEDTLSRKFIYTSFADGSGRFWFGTKQDGVLAITPSGKKVNYLHIPLSFNLVSNFFEDREKNIWIAGFRGLVKASPSPYRTITVTGVKKINSIRNCIALPTGKMLLSSDDGMLYIIDVSSKNIMAAQVVAAFRLAEQGDFIDHYCFDEKQRIWFTTREGTLYRLDEQRLINATSIISFKNTSLRGLAYNKKTKQLFVCGDSVLLAGNETRLDTFLTSNKKKFIPIPYLVYINESDGAALVQSMEDGAFLITAKGEIDSIGKGLNLFSSIHVNEDGDNAEMILWAAHQGKDISKYLWTGSQRPGLLEKIGESDGLTENSILTIALDKQERLWIATTTGVTIMQKNGQNNWTHEDIEITEPGSAPPLPFTKFAADGDGNMWMNLGVKLLVFDHNKINIAPRQTQTIVEKVLLFDHPTTWATLTDSVESYRQLPINPLLKHDENTLSIVFNGLLFNENSSLEYSYRLLPSDTAWSGATASNIVSLYQLAPGTYQFQVRSHVRGFDWSTPAKFTFTIKTPFWETWWFRLMIVLGASSLIVVIFRYRLRQLKERAAMSNQIRELEMKALKAQMNPHFIHNALNSIQSLIINNRPTEASHYISKFARLLRQVLENADKNIITLDKELYSLQLYVDLEMLRLNMDVDYKERVDENVITAEIRIPPLILQPFVENALWHGLSNKQGSKQIIVSIKEQGQWIICEITDNGIGRKKAGEGAPPFPEGSFSKAISITTQRLKDFNQSPLVEPVSFSDLTDEEGAAGTSVVIRIRLR